MTSFLRISLWDSCMSFLEINTILYLQHLKVYPVTIVHTSHFLVCWPNSQVIILSVNIASRSSKVPMAAIILLCDPYLPCPWLTGPGARHPMQVGPISVFRLETWDWSMAEPVKHIVGSCGVAMYLRVGEETKERRIRQKLRERQKNFSSDTFSVPRSSSFLTPDCVLAWLVWCTLMSFHKPPFFCLC